MEIFLDIDGVIADWEASSYASPFVYGSPEYWNDLDYSFYANIPIINGARTFYYQLCGIAPVKFLSACVLTIGCPSGKAKWLVDFVGGNHNILKEMILCRAEYKPYLAKPNRILIDDKLETILKWREEGGIGIHHISFENSLNELKKYIRNKDV